MSDVCLKWKPYQHRRPYAARPRRWFGNRDVVFSVERGMPAQAAKSLEHLAWLLS